MSTGSFPGVKSGQGVTLTPHSLLVPWSWKSRAIPLLPLWAVGPVQSLSACTRVHFTFTFTFFSLTSFYVLTVGVESYCHTWSHSESHKYYVGLLWKKDRLVIETSTRQNTTVTTDRTSMPPAGFEPAIQASEWPQTHALDHAATRIGLDT